MIRYTVLAQRHSSLLVAGWWAGCRKSKQATPDGLVFCNDRIGVAIIEGVTGSGVERTQPVEAEGGVCVAQWIGNGIAAQRTKACVEDFQQLSNVCDVGY